MTHAIISIILGIVEGITEFLPISSTGHLIIFNKWFFFQGEFTKLFDVFIQLGAILSVLVVYKDCLRPSKNTWKKLIVAVIPAIILGGLLGSFIEGHFFSIKLVATTLILGGIAIIISERMFAKKEIVTDLGNLEGNLENVTYKKAFLIGLCQCVALIPGVSRSLATILGARFLGINKIGSTEFSFLLAIPTMIAASGYSLLHHMNSISTDNLAILVIGFFIAFLTALIAIKGLIKYIQKHDFKIFGWYRILVGAIILTLFI